MKYFFALFAILISFNITIAQNAPVGIFQYNTDIGNPKKAGSATYDLTDQSYSLKGAGYNIWVQRDEFHYLYNKIKGDFILTANFDFVGKGTELHRKIGWMIRDSEDEKSPHIDAALHGDGLTALQWRGSDRAAMKRVPEYEIYSDTSGNKVIQLERSGKTITMRIAQTGEPFKTVGSREMENLPDEVLAGLFICSHNPEVVEEVRVWNVRIDKPVAETYTSYNLGCRLETMNVFDGKRKVILQTPGRFEAPNWMRDGKKLLINMADGSLCKIPIEGGALEKLNTGIADNNNNDHVISFDGKMLAITHKRKGFPSTGATVYVLPIEGGVPKLITEVSPSYLHGWAPNNKEILYISQLPGKTVFNIFRNSINGGKEVALTDIKEGEHVDGPEYSPDGKYIYYNGSQTGTMKIWRMKPDGSGKEQITFDKYNDWFPHISPDGKWIVLISFPPEVVANLHPAYKRVMLRIMPASGGEPKVIAYLYGGQGTMNVPSWSPDSKRIAFASNWGKE